MISKAGIQFSIVQGLSNILSLFSDDGTIGSDKYSGLSYPNTTHLVIDRSFCLSLCAVDESCAALFNDEVNRMCHRSTLPSVFNIDIWNNSYGSARVKNNKRHQLQFSMISETLALGKERDMYYILIISC